MLKLFDEKNAVKRTKEKISKIEKALIDFKQKKPLAEKALTEKTGFDFGDTLYNLSLKDHKEFDGVLRSSDFKGEYRNTEIERIKKFKAFLDNAIPHAEAKLAFLSKQLTEEEAQLETARKTLHQEDQRQADLVVQQQGELNKIQIEKLRLETEHAEQEQARRKARLDQLNQLSNRSENIRRELESDWKQRRAEQDSERENLYKFIFDQNDKS